MLKIIMGIRIYSYRVVNFFNQIVANYYGANKTLEYVPGKRIHWSGGRLDPPPDTPKCGYDGSLCPDNSQYSSIKIYSV